MRTQLTRLRAALVLLLVGSGLLFAIGSTIERHQHHTEQPAATAGNGESGESGGESGSESGTQHVEKSHGEAGVNTESLALTIVAVVASLLLALAVWLRHWPRLILLLVAGSGLVFAAGDGRELVHQLDESNADIAVSAGILIGLHLAVTALAAALFLRSTDADRSTAVEPAT
jgi:hypothetical protein